MARGPTLRTQRLTLRRWRKSDLKPFAALNADPEVMEHFPGLVSEADTARFIATVEHHFQDHGFGLWAVEHAGTSEFIGFTGLFVPSFEAHFTPAVEVGWRLSQTSWGFGYATEAARAAIDFGFDVAGLDEIVSFTVPSNTRSVAVMERLGLHHNPEDDFDHPSLPDDSTLKRHVLYRISAEQWAAMNAE